MTNIETNDTIVIGGGCFWCTEAIFQDIYGINKVESGYSGGINENPTYDQICSGNTGHAEVIRLQFDSKIINLNQILEIFFAMHDPTTLNRQGADIGTQYRSVIFYSNENQKNIAQKIIDKLENNNTYKNKIVTEITPLKQFFKAENYHQNYYKNNSNQPYCTFVISPKLQKLKDKYKDKLK